MDFRESSGRVLSQEDTSVEAGFSNFIYIDRNYDSNLVLRRIFSLARKLQFRSLLVEQIDGADCKLLDEENEQLAVRKSAFKGSIVHRLSFFKNAKGTHPNADDFLGYVIYKRDFFSDVASPTVHIFESVTRPFRQKAQNNFIEPLRKYRVNTCIGAFEVEGVLYAQQNALTFVCAHVALRTVLASVLPAGDVSYRVLNDLVGVDHKTRQLGGLGPVDFEKIFSHFGLHFQKSIHEPSQNLILPTDYQRDLYGLIESGVPAILGFELGSPQTAGAVPQRHAIPVIGHTFNEDTWLPQADQAYFGGRLAYYPSENWLSTFVIHDDNFGPYLCLPRHFLKKDNFRLLYGIKKQHTEFSAVQAEAFAFDCFLAIAKHMSAGGEWFVRFSSFAIRNWLVLRTMLVEKAQYLGHLRLLRDWEGNPLQQSAISEIETLLPDSFWMIEASAPELFASSRRKFGEILLNKDKPLSSGFELIIAARLPGLMALAESGKLRVEKISLVGHSSLFTYS
ncbi:MAG: hypothetical protein JWM99_5213 [Verrucomicrobiales bacterium]|nr:hypothetical protein [Verrucomicrobiales bacterium]